MPLLRIQYGFSVLQIIKQKDYKWTLSFWQQYSPVEMTKTITYLSPQLLFGIDGSPVHRRMCCGAGKLTRSITYWTSSLHSTLRGSSPLSAKGKRICRLLGLPTPCVTHCAVCGRTAPCVDRVISVYRVSVVCLGSRIKCWTPSVRLSVRSSRASDFLEIGKLFRNF